jgi:hypothetical protein
MRVSGSDRSIVTVAPVVKRKRVRPRRPYGVDWWQTLLCLEPCQDSEQSFFGCEGSSGRKCPLDRFDIRNWDYDSIHLGDSPIVFVCKRPAEAVLT